MSALTAPAVAPAAGTAPTQAQQEQVLTGGTFNACVGFFCVRKGEGKIAAMATELWCALLLLA
jgi:hypothetical protein